MRTIIIIILSILCMSMYSQGKGKCIITGKVVDKDNNPIENATIELTTETGVITEKSDNKGKYCLKDIGNGNYDLIIYKHEKGSVRFEGGDGIVVNKGKLKMKTIVLSDVENELDLEYAKIIKKADEMFAVKNYQKALELYKRSLSFKPSDKYPADKIDQIEKILK